MMSPSLLEATRLARLGRKVPCLLQMTESQRLDLRILAWGGDGQLPFYQRRDLALFEESVAVFLSLGQLFGYLNETKRI